MTAFTFTFDNGTSTSSAFGSGASFTWAPSTPPPKRLPPWGLLHWMLLGGDGIGCLVVVSDDEAGIEDSVAMVKQSGCVPPGLRPVRAKWGGRPVLAVPIHLPRLLRRPWRTVDDDDCDDEPRPSRVPLRLAQPETVLLERSTHEDPHARH